MSLRLYVEVPLSAGLEFALPDEAARHVQVRRLQPGHALRLFDGQGGEWAAEVLRMGKRDVEVRVGAHDAVDRGLPCRLELAVGMPANERMDDLVEKATELGVSALAPLLCERSVLRLEGERAHRRLAHWRAVAASAAQQCGRTHVPVIHPVRTLPAWLAQLAGEGVGAQGCRGVVMSTGDAPSLRALVGAAPPRHWIGLSGPEGGLTQEEEAAAVGAGFTRASLGPLILRADTAPLAWLAQMALLLS